ncbi:hypothetical protein GE09DRAFT_1112648 [Coniochaeta sp. 2T2.1]|nr:hypothetical protein GE09DRAFT_1112648 [Coniochaeta sp. 2T2.1]
MRCLGEKVESLTSCPPNWYCATVAATYGCIKYSCEYQGRRYMSTSPWPTSQKPHLVSCGRKWECKWGIRISTWDIPVVLPLSAFSRGNTRARHAGSWSVNLLTWETICRLVTEALSFARDDRTALCNSSPPAKKGSWTTSPRRRLRCGLHPARSR